MTSVEKQQPENMPVLSVTEHDVQTAGVEPSVILQSSAHSLW